MKPFLELLATCFFPVALIGGLALSFVYVGDPRYGLSGCSGRNESMNFNRQYGKWRVRYPEGYYSQPFCRDVADDYAEMFNGVVVPASEYKTVKEVNDAKALEYAEADIKAAGFAISRQSTNS